MEIEDFDDLEKKNAVVMPRCEKMLNEATEYYVKENLPEQAKELAGKFRYMVKLIEAVPGIGTPWKNGIRTVLIRKYRYNIYYRETETNIEILGIWHTSRGTEFEGED
jgi:plasmid stabilization system protein ParE